MPWEARLRQRGSKTSEGAFKGAGGTGNRILLKSAGRKEEMQEKKIKMHKFMFYMSGSLQQDNFRSGKRQVVRKRRFSIFDKFKDFVELPLPGRSSV